MGEREIENFNFNMRVIKNSLDVISSEKLATREVIQNEVKIILNMLNECEELVTK